MRLVQPVAHLLGVGDEIRRHVRGRTASPRHVEFGLHAFRFLDRDDALVADLLHRLGDHLADFGLAIGGDRADLRRLGLGGDLLRALLQFLDERGDGLVDAALQIHRVHAGGDRPAALTHDRLRQHDRSRGAVARDIVGLGRDLAYHLHAHVLELVGSSISLATVTPSLVMRGAP